MNHPEFIKPAPPTSGPWIVAGIEATNPSPVGEMFVGIANPETGRCIARVSAWERVDAEDMGNAYLFGAARELLAVARNAVNVLEVFLDWEEHRERVDAEFCAQLRANLDAARSAIAKSQGD